MANQLPKVALFGANGQLGQIILKNLYGRNIPKISCLIRHKATRLKNSNLVNEVVVGDCSNVNDCKEVCKDADIVVSTITPPPTSRNFVTELVSGTKNIIEAAKSSDVKQIIIVGFDCLNVFQSAGRYLKMILDGLAPFSQRVSL